MGDYTNVQVYIYSCPTESHQAVLDILADHRLSGDWHGGPEESDTLALGEAYGNNSGAGDESSEIADEIMEAAPGATFLTWTDPAYDWLGVGVMHTPELGPFVYESAASGQPVFSQAQIIAAIGEDNTERAIGMPWTVALNALGAQL